MNEGHGNENDNTRWKMDLLERRLVRAERLLFLGHDFVDDGTGLCVECKEGRHSWQTPLFGPGSQAEGLGLNHAVQGERTWETRRTSDGYWVALVARWGVGPAWRTENEAAEFAAGFVDRTTAPLRAECARRESETIGLRSQLEDATRMLEHEQRLMKGLWGDLKEIARRIDPEWKDGNTLDILKGVAAKCEQLRAEVERLREDLSPDVRTCPCGGYRLDHAHGWGWTVLDRAVVAERQREIDEVKTLREHAERAMRQLEESTRQQKCASKNARYYADMAHRHEASLANAERRTIERLARALEGGIHQWQGHARSWLCEQLPTEDTSPADEPARPNHLIWCDNEWVDDRCGCRYHPDDDNGTHGGAPHVHRCERHATTIEVSASQSKVSAKSPTSPTGADEPGVYHCAGCQKTIDENRGEASWCPSDCVCIGAVWCAPCWQRHIDSKVAAREEGRSEGARETWIAVRDAILSVENQRTAARITSTESTPTTEEPT